MNGNIIFFIYLCFREQVTVIVAAVVKHEWYEITLFLFHIYITLFMFSPSIPTSQMTMISDNSDI